MIARPFSPSPLTFRGIVVVGISAVALVAAGGREDKPPVPERSHTVLSKTFEIDRTYRSMKGPYDMQQVRLLETDEPELLWITGYEAVMVGADGESPMPQEFMCHSNLDINTDAHRRALGLNTTYSSRLFTLSQGQFSIHFPEGFGIPMLSNEALDLTTQVLNLNLEGKSVEVRHKVTVEFVRDRDLEAPLTPLFPTSAYGLALLDGKDGYFGVMDVDPAKQGPGCLPGENASGHTYPDGMGRTFTGHWVVPPGRQVNRTLVTRLMNVTYDTTIHYVAVHLHPFAESLELRDLTADRTLFHSTARNFEDKIGLAHVESLSSPEGIPVYHDHEYELVSTYDNTTDEPQDSMAVMYLYLRDLELEKTGLAALRKAPGTPVTTGR